MPRYLAVLIFSLILWMPGAVFALGLGDIDLKSALNQTFAAEIPVSTDSEYDIAALNVGLASNDTFEKYGLERAAFLNSFEFEIVANGANGVVLITSTEPVVEPFVTLLLEISSPQGRLLREYTVLLDPPVFSGVAAAPAVAAATAGPAPAPKPVARSESSQPSSQPSPRPAPQASPRPAPAPATVSGPSGDSYGPVQRAETLWGIAGRYADTVGVNRNQAMVAIYRANPEAFIGNINRLKAGMILRIPGGDEFRAVSRGDAFAEVQSQNEAWRDRGSAPKKESGTLRLVPPPEAAGTEAGAEPVGSSGETAAAGSTGDSDAAALRGRVSQLENELAESRRLIELRDQELQQLQESLARGDQAVAADAPADSITAPPVIDEPALIEDPADSVPAESGQAAAKPSVTTTKPAEESSIIGELFTNIWLYVALGGVLLVALFLVRRRSAEPESPAWSPLDDESDIIEEVAESTQQLSPPPAADDAILVEESAPEETDQDQAPPFAPEAADIFATSEEVPETPLERTISTETPVNLDEADPIAEADFHMAYGLYDQAADLLSNALNSEPDKNDLRLKLLEVYFIWENQGGFLREAQALRERIQDPADSDWSKVLIMGKQICPDEELFSDTPAAVGVTGEMDFPLADEGQQDDGVGLDFDFSSDRSAAGDLGLDEGTSGDLDFDMSEVGLGVEGESSDSLDFDISEAEESSLVAEDFDGSDNAPTMESPIEPPPSADATLETPTIESEALDLDALDPTMESPIAPPSADSTLETPTIESPIGQFEEDAGVADQTAEIELDDLGLDLSGLDAAAEMMDEGDQDAGDGDDEIADSSLAAETLQVEVDSLEALDDTSQHEALGVGIDEVLGDADDSDPTGEMPQIGDTEEQPALDVTAEQPAPFADADAGEALIEPGELAGDVDFEIGEDLPDGDATTHVVPAAAGNGATQTELGTKLDLARAYIDMGDPDGAKSILNEVLEEAPVEQRQEAQKLLDDLDS